MNEDGVGCFVEKAKIKTKKKSNLFNKELRQKLAIKALRKTKITITPSDVR